LLNTTAQSPSPLFWTMPDTRCITTAPYKYADELESLLTWNFQSFKEVQLLAA
jgi:hypothetical protein